MMKNMTKLVYQEKSYTIHAVRAPDCDQSNLHRG